MPQGPAGRQGLSGLSPVRRGNGTRRTPGITHDDGLAERVRRALGRRRGVSEREMFGGLCFMLDGNMLCGVARPGLMLRVGKDQEAHALSRPGARPMDFTGRRLGGFVWVDPAACRGPALARWIALAERFVASLPPKASAPAPPRQRGRGAAPRHRTRGSRREA